MSLFDPRDFDETLRDASYCPRARDRRHQGQRTLDMRVVCTFCGMEVERDELELPDREIPDRRLRSP